jgi:hypothetical protein
MSESSYFSFINAANVVSDEPAMRENLRRAQRLLWVFSGLVTHPGVRSLDRQDGRYE